MYATNLESELRSRGINPGFVAREVGINIKTLHNYMKGLREPTISRARKIAKILERPLDQIFPEEPDRAPDAKASFS